MRKLLILTLGLFLFIGAYSQPNMRTTAFNHLRYGKLDKAKEAIDKAIEHPKPSMMSVHGFSMEIFIRLSICRMRLHIKN